MTDKVQKIREEVVGIINSINLFAPDEDGKNSSYEEGRLVVASQILQIIDSLQEEPKKKCMYSNGNYTAEERKVLCDGCKEECKYARKEADWLQELQCKLDSMSKEDFEQVWKKYETEAVSEELEEASRNYVDNEEYGDDVYFSIKASFKAGAKWQKEQMLKKSFGATVCKYLNTFLKEMDKDAISQALREYTNGDRVRVLIIKQE